MIYYNKIKKFKMRLRKFRFLKNSLALNFMHQKNKFKCKTILKFKMRATLEIWK